MHLVKPPILILVATLCCLAANVNGQAVMVSEDFSSSSGTTPPAGWSVTTGPTHNADSAVLWRFLSPQPSTGISPPFAIPAPFAEPYAMSNTDFDYNPQTDTSLVSPAFDSSLAENTLLDFDYAFLVSDGIGSGTVEVFDGIVWNVHTTLVENNPSNSNVTSSHQHLDLTALCGSAPNAQVRFRHNMTDCWHYAIDNVDIVVVDDFAIMVNIMNGPSIGPECDLNLTSSEVISFDYTNHGLPLAPITDLAIQCSMNGVVVLLEYQNLVNGLDTGEQGSYTTSATVDMATPGANTLEILAYGNADPSPTSGNNTPLVVPFNNPFGFGYTESFDSIPFNTSSGPVTTNAVPAGWENAQDDAATILGNAFDDWYPHRGPTSSSAGLAGPASDHTQGLGGLGNYMYIEDTFNGLSTGDIHLRSPCLNLSGATNSPTIQFWHHSDEDPNSVNAVPLDIDVINMSTGATVSMSVIPTITGNGIGSGWTQVFVDLTAFGTDTVKIQFRSNNDNSTFMDDMAIDDFSFFDGGIPTGQAPTPGIAMFDVNNAVNVNGQTVDSAAKGPYTANVAVGSTMQFSWSGLPLQFVQCWGGPLLPCAAIFPGIGQIDTGDGTTDPSGIPGGLFLVGSGLNVGIGNGTFFDTFFFTDLSGTGGFSANVPDFLLAPGVLSTFQLFIQDPVSGIAQTTISNAVTVILTP
ncbi:MAG: hypothetical protein ACI97A_001028 [Planctomycetota bacterium]|jgi:hypothetical protein